MATDTLIRPTTPGRGARPSVRQLGPNWYATVMGTAIVATAGASLPTGPPKPLLTAMWVLSVLALAALLIARAAHWTRHPEQARSHLDNPVVAPFYGCLAMALLAVGAAGMAVDAPGAVPMAATLWIAGTLTSLATATVIPYLMIAKHRIERGSAAPVWLLPVVAPMVSAATGPLLVPHLPPGQWREAMLLGCLALFGMSLLAVLLILPLIVSRLLHEGPLPLALTPTLFLVLGPLGQSTTAAGNLADAAPGTEILSIAYGVPVLGFALLWLALAGSLVVRAARRGMGFTMTWWAFTFPVGTCVTGAAVLARHTGLHAFTWLAVALYALLLAGWLAAAMHTSRGLLNGTLLAAPR